MANVYSSLKLFQYKAHLDAVRDRKILAGPGPGCFTLADGGVWHADFWAQSTIKTSLDGKLLDWGDRVFEEGVAGLAFDGEHLWALDRAAGRICVIERTPPNET